jgi:hypothetical protein
MGAERQVAICDLNGEASRGTEIRAHAPITWDEIGGIASTSTPFSHQSETSGHNSKVVDDSVRRFVWRSPRDLHPHPALQRYGVAATTAERNKLAQQDDPAFQQAIEITTRGTILDGLPQWHQALNVDKVLCIQYSLTDEQALEWLLKRHRRRNGWNKYCRIVTALELEPKFRQDALANQKAAGQKTELSGLTKAEKMHVRSKLAELADVCEAYIDYVKELRDEADESILQALECGEISIYWAWTLLKFSRSGQRQILANRRAEKAASVTYPRPRKPQTVSVDPSRMLQVWRLLVARDARDIKCSVVSIGTKRVEIRVQINEELFTSMQSQGELKLL